jgi:hypothetical protein
MFMDIHSPRPVTINKSVSSSQPHEEDLLNRGDLIARLTPMLSRLQNGAVLAIDGSWGSGKSWFIKNWHERLLTEGYSTSHMDAFEQDYNDDPFTQIISSLIDLVKGENKHEMATAAAKVSIALLPLATRLGVNALGRVFLGTTDLSGTVEGVFKSSYEEVSSSLEHKVSLVLQEQKEKARSVQNLREKLEAYCTNSNHPVVVFIDELDRCRPDYAVKMLERINHFFGITNLVFIIAINSEELLSSIRNYYGQSIDANGYLDKFISLTAKLPQTFSSAGPEVVDGYRKYIESRYTAFGLFGVTTAFQPFFIFICKFFNLSFRSIDRALSLSAVALPPQSSKGVREILVAYFSVISIKYPDIWKYMVNDIPKGHSEMIDNISNEKRRNSLNDIRHDVYHTDEMHLIEEFHESYTKWSPDNPNQQQIDALKSEFKSIVKQFNLFA